MNRKSMLRKFQEYLNKLDDLYMDVEELYDGEGADEVLDELATVIGRFEHAYTRARKVTEDELPAELRVLTDELNAALSEDPDSMVAIDGRKIKGTSRKGMWRGKTGKYSFRYRRPSGFMWFVPENGFGSDHCVEDGFVIVGHMAVDKLQDEIAWIKAGKPRQVIWARQFGSQQRAA